MNFSIKNDNPFRIFSQLQNIAHEQCGTKNTIDLSRGDPGLGFSPSQAGRNFFGFLISADTLFNNEHKNYKRDFANFDSDILLHFMEEGLEKIYNQKTLLGHMNDFHALLNLIVSLSEKQGNPITKKEVFDELFLFSNVSGGHYHIPEGEKIVRIVIADQLKKICQQNIPINNIIETSGASHGIATLFKLCTHPNIDFLSEGDTVLSISPNYSPYNDLFRQFKLDVQPLVIDSETGEVQIDNVIDITKKIKMISMIDPNNPTGHMIQPEQLKKIAELARKLDAIILTDEIYAEFFLERRTSIIDFAPERTLLLGGASKIQRSTGLRLGYFAFTDACADYLTKKILNGVGDIRKSLINAKAPGGIQGVFYHVSCVPGPSQFLALSHMVFGEIEKQNYIQKVQKNMNTFFEVIKRPYKNNMYFAILDLDPHNKSTSAEELFVGLAKKGIVVIPAYNFFSPNMRTDKHLTYARVSIPNATHEQIIDAAQVIRDMIA